MENILEESVLSVRPTWPYIVGMLGGLLLAVGALMFLLLFASPGHAASGPLTLATFSGGAALLAISWLQIAKHRGTTMVPVAGSAAMVASFFVMLHSATSPAEARVAALLLFYAFAAFALSHAFVAELKAVRILAGIAALPAIVIAVCETARKPEASSMILVDVMFAAFVVMGVALAVTMPSLRHQMPEDR